VTKKKSKWDSIADLIWETPTTIEGIFIAIPYLILNSIGTFFKVSFLSLVSILSLNKWKKLSELWNKEYLKQNLVEPWNCVLALVIIIIMAIIF
jgi:ABC-type microcin C transport system permease subunit YejE